MSKPRLFLACIFTLLVGAAIYCNALGSIPVVKATEAKNEKWEYAELSWVQPVGGLKGTVSWEGPKNARTTSTTFSGIAEFLEKKISTEDSTALLNVLGDEMWELVSHSTHFRVDTAAVPIHAVYNAWTLRRRK